MTYEELLSIAKSLYNFYPDEEFNNLADIVYAGKKATYNSQFQEYTLSILARYLIEYVDGLHKEQKERGNRKGIPGKEEEGA